ncbi:methyltransferase [Ruminococcaceae bacterium OttesenSCG-928-A16]|nr:methyltransferase [Ruminococcaceae bacterium OttesenSCG-928-A16]
MQHTVETLPGGTRVWVNAQHRFGTDALLLAAFCNPKRNWSVCDLGSGSGILLLSLLDKGLQGPATGVELDEAGAALLAGTAAENGYANVQAVCANLQHYRSPHLVDMVVANPPYFAAGLLPPTARRAAARHETTATIADFCAAAARMLKDGGPFCVCFPPARLADLIAALRQHKLEPKRMQFVRNAAEAPPWLVLLDARKAGGVGLQILPDRIVPHGQPVEY